MVLRGAAGRQIVPLWVLPYLGTLGGSAVMIRGSIARHPFWGFSIRLGPYFVHLHNPIDPSICRKKIGLSLSHLVPEILGPKVALIFHQNNLFNNFYSRAEPG